MSKEVVQVVASLDFSVIDGQKYPLIVQEEPRHYDFDSGSGYNIGLMSLEPSSPLYLQPIKIKLLSDTDPNLNVGDQVKVDYDSDASTLYASTRQNSSFASVEISLKATAIHKVENAPSNK